MPNEEQLLGYLKRVTGELHQTRQRLREAESEEREPIAIVGMACRYPGGVSSPEDLWRLVAEGTDAIGDFPDDRGWDTGALYDADPDRPGTSYVRQGGFLTGAGEFDAGLFGISPREALAMDPQQRLMLVLAWEAFERAGLAPDSLEGRSVGVFVGSGGQDYFDDLSADAMGEAVERYLSTGNAGAVLSGRVSYTFGLQGPAVTIDTACSSSLVALHTAVRSLRQKECSLALAGGVMVMSTPSPFVAFSRQRGLAADGRCKSFSDGADGTGWSEGAGMLLVERLSDARRLGHPVLAVVRGSAVNQDGASNGMTAPSGPAQQRVIRQALADAGLRAADVDVVEGHGTGTRLGDPIEAQALLATYGQERGEEGAGRPLWLGSVKSNLGHTQAAAGVAGVIKMVMAMRRGVLPQTLHVDAPSGQVDWSAGRVELLTESAAWPVGDRPRRAGVSSFGVSGTNAHIILEQAEAEAEGDDTYLDGEDRPTESASASLSGTTPVPLPVSGRDATALSAQADGLVKHLTDGSQHNLTDVGYALGTTRAALEHRAVVLAADRATAERGLTAVSLTHDDPAVVRGVVGEGSTGFVFSGQGSGWWGVGRELYGVFPVFAAAFDAVCVELDPLVGGSLREVLWSRDAPEAGVVGSVWVQAGLFAVQVGLFRLWESWGVVPDVVAGHSIGELAAAHVAGVWSLADACRVVAARGRLMDGLPAGGVMAAVAVSEEDIVPWLSEGVSLAAVNGPASVVVSGAGPDVEPVVAHFEAQGVPVRWLEVTHGFHSALMEPMLADFRDVLDQVTFTAPGLGAVSTVTGGSVVGEWSSPAYWVRQVREPVRFADAVKELEARGVGRFVELGPGAAFSGLVSGCVQNPATATVVASLRGGRGEVESVTAAAARLHVVGQRLDWEAFFTAREDQARRPRRVELPTYAFQCQRYWLGRRNGLDNPSFLGLDSAGHPFLGALTVVADSGVTVLTGRLSTESLPWLADHTVHGDILLPGTAFVELAIRAGDQVACEGLEELTLHAPLVLPEDGTVRIQVVVGAPDEAGARTVGIYAYEERDSHEPVWTLHADGVLVPKGRIADFELGSWPPADAEPVALDGLADALAAAGLAYGAPFQGLRAVWRRGEEIFAEVRLPSDGANPHEAEKFALHPAALDAGTQALQTVGGGADQDDETGSVRLPFSWSGVSLHATGADSLRMRFTPRGQNTFSIAIADVEGEPVASVDSVTFRPAAATSPAPVGAGDSVYRLQWVPSASTPESAPASSSASLTAPRTAPPTTAEYDELSAAATVPGLVLLRSAEPAGGPGTTEEVGAAVHRVLEAIQHWLGDERFTSSTLAVCTRGAAPVSGSGTAADLAAAAVWGLVRSAQAEHPGRFVLVDVDSADGPRELPRAAAAVVATGEPQGAVRDGLVYAPRLAHGPGAEEAGVPTRQPADFDTHGSVLLTGASGAVGGAVARHLVTRHGVRHLVLPGRRGAEAPGLSGLVRELADLGAEITTPVCDIADRQAVADLLAGIPAERPLTAVLHAAGVLDDGVVTEMTPERIDTVLRPKVYGALNLHDLTRDHDLTHFVLFSSVSGLFGAPGQSNYATANTFLDGLAELRRAQGLPGQSMAWGPWSTDGGMTAGLDDGAHARIRRSGVLPTSVRTGLALFDAALASSAAMVVPIIIDAEALRTRPGTLPAAFRGLAAGAPKPSSRRRAATLSSGTGAVDGDGDGGVVEPGTLAARLVDLPKEERVQTLRELVRSEVASVLGHGSGAAVDPQREFHQLGFDSLMAVELRNALSAATAVRLPATLVFDYPTVTSLADHLLAELIGTADPLDRSATPVATKKTDDEPIAIVGMACRYPGGVSSPEDLWRLVAEGTDAIGGFPDDRGWDLDRLYDPKAERPGTSYVREGGFLLDAGDFDAGFFGIPPREAATVDPQQRLLLETSWEALERAGIDPLSLKGSSTGVFAGIQYHDYAGSASTGSIASGRIAYTFGLEGPAISVDTACSSSLVAMHWAGRSLRAGECSLALAGGVTVMATPETFVEFSRQNGLSKGARCKAYSGTADGTAWSEGVGMVVLERLSDARRLGHPVLAVVRGSAVNQDGASNGMTAPNGPAQQRVIRQALADAGLRAADVDVVEGHGTGTRLGDPIEAQALLATYGQERGEEGAGRPLWLGSVKSNLGHTQAAAGVAGVIKMVMAMRQGVLPQTLHVDEPTPHVDWSAGRVELLTESAAWPVGDRPRRAGVSSFGISGTNAHLVLEQPLDAGRAEERTPQGTDDAGTAAPLPWFVSARNLEALRTQAERLLTYVDDAPELDAVDIAHSTVLSRGSMEHRAVVIGSNRGEHLMGLLALVDGEESRGVVRGVVDGGLKSGFVFSGQGSGWWGVGRELYGVFPVFAAAFDAVCGELDPLVGGSLREVLWSQDAPEAGVVGSMWVQAGLFAVQVGLFRLWESWGVTPDVVAGHSVGELAAAHVAGVWSLADACRVVAARGRLMDGLPAGGVMAAVAVSETDIEPWLSEGVSLAAVNGPASVVVSGAGPDVEPVVAHFEAQGVPVRWLEVTHGFHSALMEPMLADFRDVLDQVAFAEPRLGAVSTVTGGSVVGEWSSPAYWVRQVREPVRFADAVKELEARGVGRFVELGPGSVLSGLVSGCVQDPATATVVASLRGGRGEVESVTAAAAGLHVVGQRVDWEAFFTGGGHRRGVRVELPTYAFQRQRYWLQESSGGDAGSLGLGVVEHPLLSAVVESPESGGVVLTGRLSLASQPWLTDHRVHGLVVVPGTALVELAIRAGDQVGCGHLEELTLEGPLVLPESGAVAVQVAVGSVDASGSRPVSVYSRAAEAETQVSWVRHAQGAVRTAKADSPTGGTDLSVWPPKRAQRVELEGLYDGLAEGGFVYGPAFRGLGGVWRRGGEVFAEVTLPEGVAGVAGVEGFGLHPAVLDAALHAVGAGGVSDLGGVPFAWSGVELWAAGASSVRVRVAPVGASGAVSLELADGAGAPVASVESLVVRPVSAEQISAAAGPDGAAGGELFRVEWPVAMTAAAGVAAGGGWAVLGEGHWVTGDDEARRCADLTSLGELVSGGLTVPDVVVAPMFDMAFAEGQVTAAGVRAGVGRVLEMAQAWLSDERYASSRLVVVTRNAVDTGSGAAVDVASAAVWGLIRSALAEHPGRFGLLDVDEADCPVETLRVQVFSGEDEAAIRRGKVRVPRLARSTPSLGTDTNGGVESGSWGPEGTVLITGGLGGLGRAVARHLVTEHGVRRLLLVSRSGTRAEGADETAEQLSALGAEVRIAACDVAERDATRELLEAIPAEHPLTAVIHAAGVVDDGVVTSLTLERLERVLRPKVDAAWNLHELTVELGLEPSAFVLFSSAAGVLGAPGQAGYAAGNTFLDGLAAYRRSLGLAAQSLAWGLWSAEQGGMAAGLNSEDHSRLSRDGIAPLSTADGLTLLDTAWTVPDPLLLPLHLELQALGQAADELPSLFRGLIRPPVTRRSSAAAEPGGRAGLLERLLGLSSQERETELLDLLRTEAAVLLGHPGREAIEPGRSFNDLGFDSLSAVGFRNKLNLLTGMKLPATLIFDYPTSHDLARHLAAELGPDSDDEANTEDAEAGVREILQTIPLARLRDAGLLDSLYELAGHEDEHTAPDTSGEDAIDAMDTDKLISLALQDAGDDDATGEE
ncbi:SDR family NAD(P)-dependent oxidoreductase [Streptomyces tendae]